MRRRVSHVLHNSSGAKGWREKMLLVDTRQGWEYRTGHIADAVHFSMKPTWRALGLPEPDIPKKRLKDRLFGR